jgi:hypothetical protein
MADTMAATFDKVIEHEEKFNIHHKRIKVLEDADMKHDERLKRLEDNAIKLENIVMSESRETRMTIVEQNKQLFSLVESTLGIKAKTVTQQHELKVLKWNHISNIMLKFGSGIVLLLGSGTGVFMIIEHFFGK